MKRIKQGKKTRKEEALGTTTKSVRMFINDKSKETRREGKRAIA